MSSAKPTLPSIKLMLEGAGIQSTIPFDTGRTNKPGASYHRRHASDVVSHLENLTLSTPTPLEPNASSNRLTATPSSQSPATTTATAAATTTAASHNNSIPNWPSPFRPTPLYQHPYHHHRSARNLHSRSYSDYTHPYLTTPPTPAAPAASHHGYLTPQHRRTVSTSTLDSMIHHQHQHAHRPAFDSYTPSPPVLYPSHSTSTLSQSPTLSIRTPSSVDDQHQHPPHHLFDTDEDDVCDDDNHSHGSSNKNTGGSGTTMRMAGSSPSSSPATATTDDNGTINNKYQCPYCQKGFSRPSSLRIHTYSHTGEKPFTCPEPNCDRAFSVQSNMRRHIRVHKLNGKHLKMRRSPPPIKPLAAKPSWMPLPSH